MSRPYDIAVIGAGIGGLTAGALLAKQGYKVGVFEAGRVPGGYCTSFRRGPYTFDSALDAISGCSDDGWLRRILRRLGVEDEVGMVRLDPLRVDVFGTDRVTIPGSIEGLTELLCSIAPDESERTLALIETMREIYRTAMTTTPETLFRDTRIVARPGAVGRYLGRSYKDLLDDYVKSERLRAVMSDRCAFMGLPPSRVSAISMTVMFMTYAMGGGYRISGGADNLTNALVKGLESNGGELHTKSAVTKIETTGGSVSGVSVGSVRYECRCVISAIDAAETAGLAGMDPPGAHMQPSISFMMVYLGLKKLLDIPDGMGCYPGYDIEGTFSDIAIDAASPRSSIEAINYSGISPGMAPEGGMSVMLMAKAAYGCSNDWKGIKSGLTERLIGKAEVFIPGLKAAVDVVEAATPDTLKRYTGNSGGAAFGWAQGIGNPRTPVTWPLGNLFHAGHWSYPGGGIESVAASGMVASEKAVFALNEACA